MLVQTAAVHFVVLMVQVDDETRRENNEKERPHNQQPNVHLTWTWLPKLLQN